MNQLAVRILPEIFYAADKVARSRLAHQAYAVEDSYVGALIDQVWSSCERIGLKSKYIKQLSHAPDSMLTGCDVMIVFRFGESVKIGLFEAKWPRVSREKYDWDRLQGQESHFSNQISRQGNWLESASIWELFIIEKEAGKQPTGYDEEGSTCIWHTAAHFFVQHWLGREQRWKSEFIDVLISLQNLLTLTPSFGPRNNIADAVAHTILGTRDLRKGSTRFPIKGKPFFGGPKRVLKNVGGFVELRGLDGTKLRVPCAMETVGASDDILGQAGVQYLLFVDASELGKRSRNTGKGQIHEWLFPEHGEIERVQDILKHYDSRDFDAIETSARANTYAAQILGRHRRFEKPDYGVREHSGDIGDIW